MLWTFLLDMLFPRSLLSARLGRCRFTETEQPSPSFAGRGPLLLQFMYHLSNTSGAIAKLSTGCEREEEEGKNQLIPVLSISFLALEKSVWTRVKSLKQVLVGEWPYVLKLLRNIISVSGIEAFTSKSNFFYSLRDDHDTDSNISHHYPPDDKQKISLS